LVAIVGTGVFVFKQRSTKTADSKTPSKTTTTPSSTPAQTDPKEIVTQFMTAYKANDKAKVDSLVTADMAKQVDPQATSFYDVCKKMPSEQCDGFFQNVDLSKATKTETVDYKNKDGKTGKTVKYTITADNGSSVISFDLLPKGTGWQIDSFGTDDNNQATVNGSISTQ
jgi:hypothetical protein